MAIIFHPEHGYFCGWNDDWKPKPTWIEQAPNRRIVVFGSPKQAQRTADKISGSEVIELNSIKDPRRPM